MTSGGSNFNHFAENQLIKFNARDAGDFNDVAGKREVAPKCRVPARCGRLGRSASIIYVVIHAILSMHFRFLSRCV